MPGQIQLRRMQHADLPGVESIQVCSPEAAGWNAGDYLDQASWVVEVNGALAGFAIARAVVRGVEYELLNMAITPSARRLGLGRALLERLIEEHPGVWFLEVRESNMGARGLYESVGFRVVRRRPKYYCDPVEDALEMGNHS